MLIFMQGITFQAYQYQYTDLDLLHIENKIQSCLCASLDPNYKYRCP